MNKILCLIAAGLLVTPGCLRRNSSSDTASGRSAYEKTGQRSVFDEDVESFILEEDQNPFAPQAGDSVVLVEDASLWNPDARQNQFETIYYDYDKFSVRQDQKHSLNRNIKRIKDAAKKGSTIIVEGHACTSGGSSQYNMALSESRARNVRKHLIQQGVPANKLKVVGRGSEACKVTGGNEEQQAPNRRVEFYEIDVI